MTIKQGDYPTLSKKLRKRHDTQTNQLSQIDEDYLSELDNLQLRSLFIKLTTNEIFSLRITRPLWWEKITFVNQTLKSKGIDVKKDKIFSKMLKENELSHLHSELKEGKNE